MFSRILLAVDGTPSGEVATSFAAALARRGGAQVRVVHVNELLVGGRGVTAETEREAMRVVDEAVGTLAGAGVRADGVHFVANCFTVCTRIADAAHEWGADVIVLGSRRRRRLGRLFGKGLRERITAVTDLPTLVAPPPLRVDGRLRLADLPTDAPTPPQSTLAR
jgi:nucleotide-binding universal stress UspA family protein